MSHDPLSETLVAIAIVRRGEHWLVGKRAANQALPGLAEFPGGKCLPDEPPEECARRECREESGLEVIVIRRRREMRHEYPHGRLRLIFFDCEPVAEREPKPPFRWVSRDELAALPFPAANSEVVAELLGLQHE
jgi:8-oxo-dGTP diphosphatase